MHANLPRTTYVTNRTHTAPTRRPQTLHDTELMNYDRTISPETITEMVQRIEPAWEVREATPASKGHHIVYHLDVETGTGCNRYVLKGTPSGKPSTCGDEARMLVLLDAHTSIPVPDVLGVVDEHETFPDPFFLASRLQGTNHRRTALGDFSKAAIERLARSTGRHLATLHGLDAVDAYGFVTIDANETLDGGRASADIGQVTVPDPTHSWTDYLAAEADRMVASLEETQFGDLCSTVCPVLEAQIGRLTGEFDPVIARIDQSLDNVLLDPETGAVTGLLDWEFCVAATPAYDLAFVEYSLNGGHWATVPGIPDYRKTIRTSLLDGYREVGPAHVVEQFHENYDHYALLACLHLMANFEDWCDQADVTDDQREAAVDPLRKRVESFC